MRIFFIISMFFLISFIGLSGHNGQFYFFSKQDVENIQNNTKTDWGKLVIDSLKKTVDNRLKYPLEIPMLEGGHSHEYFCPKHAIRFTFNWNEPISHYCQLCEKSWTKVNKFNWAWVNIVHNYNLDFLNACTYLLVATDETQYADYIKALLHDYALKYPTYMVHNVRRQQTELQSGKMYGQSLDEAVFASYAARAYLTAKPFMTEKDASHIENGYLKPCSELLLRQKSGGNWQVWHNSGIIALGVALQNDSLIDIALNNADRGYHKLMDRHVYKDGWWNEGSPTYHFYPLRAMILSAEALRCRNIDLYDERLHTMFVSPASGVYANLQFPAHNDGWYGESLIDQANLYEIAQMRFDDDFLKNILVRIYTKSSRMSVESLQSQHDLLDTVANEERKSVNFPHIGVALLSSGDYSVVMKYGSHGGSHGHPDKLSISMHDGKKEIITDMGTPGYGVPDYHRWYRKTLSHSTLSVDGNDQLATTGNLIRYEAYENGGLIEAEANNAYENVRMRRSLALKENQLTDIFSAESEEEHLYDYVLMLPQEPYFNESMIESNLEGSDVYKQISNVKRIGFVKSVDCSVGESKACLQSLNSDKFEVFVGMVPGIPYSKLTSSKLVSEQSVAHILIIRQKSRNIKIKTTWKLN